MKIRNFVFSRCRAAFEGAWSGADAHELREGAFPYWRSYSKDMPGRDKLPPGASMLLRATTRQKVKTCLRTTGGTFVWYGWYGCTAGVWYGCTAGVSPSLFALCPRRARALLFSCSHFLFPGPRLRRTIRIHTHRHIPRSCSVSRSHRRLHIRVHTSRARVYSRAYPNYC